MDELWIYRVLGEDFGPVSRTALVELLRDGTLGPSDVACCNGGDWQLLEACPDLLAETESDDDVPALSEDLSALLESVTEEDSRPLLSSLPSVTAASRNGWYCRVFGTELGPFDFDHLLSMIQDGELSRSDEVRQGSRGTWGRADSIVGLFAGDHPSEAESADESEMDVWYIERRGAAQGPYTFDELKQLAGSEILGERDRVREGRNGRWVRASTLVGLFDHQFHSRSIAGHATQAAKNFAEKARAGTATATATPPQEFEQVATAPSCDARNSATSADEPEDQWSNFFKKVDEREQRRSGDRPAVAPAAANAAATPAAASVPAVVSPVATTETSSMAALRTTTVSLPPMTAVSSRPTAPVFVAPRKAKTSWQMPSLGLGGLLDSLKGSGSGQNGKVVLGLVAGGLILAGVFFGPSAFGGVAGTEQFLQIEHIWEQIRELNESGSDAEAWKALHNDVKPILDQAQMDLAPIVSKYGRERPLAQHLLWLVDSSELKGPTKSNGLLRKLLSAGPNAKAEDFQNVVSIMRSASQYATTR